MKRAVAKQWIKEHMHKPIGLLIEQLNKKLVGHYRYYGISDNYKRMRSFTEYIKYQLFKHLRRRSQRHRMTYEKFNKILEYNPIVYPKIYFKLW